MKTFTQYISEGAVKKTQDVNGQKFEIDYHTTPSPSQQRVLKDVMIPYVAMYTKDGYDVILRSVKNVGLDSEFVLFRKKGSRSEVMVNKLISKNGKVTDNL
jgi:hypothetical protein